MNDVIRKGSGHAAARQTDRLLTPEEVAGKLGVKKGLLNRWRFLGTGPAYVKVSARTIRYPAAALDAFIRNNTMNALTT